MARAPRKKDIVFAEAWKRFHASPDGRAALAELFAYCNVYSPIETSDPLELARMTGERNVALRIAQLIGLKPTVFPDEAWEDTDILDKIMRSNV